MNRVHFSSDRQDWGTPQDLFDQLDAEFAFDVDVCARADNAKCQRFFSPDEDGLKQQWGGRCWMNPPYGRGVIDQWMKKAYESAMQDGCTVVCLVPARTDTRWWHRFCARGEVRFIRGRVRFVGATHCAPFPSAIVIFRPPADLSGAGGRTRYWSRHA